LIGLGGALKMNAALKDGGMAMRIAALLALLVASAATAQSTTAIDARAAQAIIAGCAAHAGAHHNQQAVVVVDTGGRVVAALRMDGAEFGKMDFAQAKAVAAAAWGFDTAGQADGAKDFPGFARAPFVQTVPGGVAVLARDGKTEIGAVGVSGGAPADDAACAVAGIHAAGLRTPNG
jgi:glc operon protein GlcG